MSTLLFELDSSGTNIGEQTRQNCCGDAQNAALQGDLPLQRTSKISSYESHHCDDAKDQNQTETDLTVKRHPRPSLKDSSVRPLESEGDPNRWRYCEGISTPPRNVPSHAHKNLRDSYCCDTSTRLCCALMKLEYLCDRFSVTSLCLTLFSVGIFIFDVITDLILSLTYFRKIDNHEDFRFFFGLTLGLVVIPSTVVQCFSYFWVWDDYRERKELQKKRKEELMRSAAKGSDSAESVTTKDVVLLLFSLILHIFQAAVLYRYIRVLVYGFKSRYFEVKKREACREHFDTLWRYELHDINMLRLLESFLESAPQLVLQIYIVLATKQIQLIVVISCIASLLALSTMMVSIQRAIRNSNPKKDQLSILASIVMFFWRLFTISSRVLAFALFLTIQPLAFLVFILIHWALSTAWIAVKGTNFCKKRVAEYFFDGICGLIYIFCFFNVHEERDGRNSHSRCRMLVFYLFIIAENSILSILWFFFRPGGDTRPLTLTGGGESIAQSDTLTPMKAFSPAKVVGVIPPAYALGLILAVHVLFFLGIVFMLIYYRFLHPRRSSSVVSCSCFVPQRQRRASVDECGTELVSAPAEQIPSQRREIVHLDHTEAYSSSVLLEVDQLGDNARQGPQELQRPRGEDDDNSETPYSRDPKWSQTVFNRGNRARKVYSRQYSREKSMDARREDDRAQLTPVQMESHDPGRSYRFIAGVTSPAASFHADASEPGSTTASFQNYSLKPQMPSVVIKSGSQTLKTAHSATRRALRSHTLPSPARTSRWSNPSSSSFRHSRKRGDLASFKGCSASTSCLARGKPPSHISRRMPTLGGEGPCASTFTINEDEVIECMESSV